MHPHYVLLQISRNSFAYFINSKPLKLTFYLKHWHPPTKHTVTIHRQKFEGKLFSMDVRCHETFSCVCANTNLAFIAPFQQLSSLAGLAAT